MCVCVWVSHWTMVYDYKKHQRFPWTPVRYWINDLGSMDLVQLSARCMPIFRPGIHWSECREKERESERVSITSWRDQISHLPCDFFFPSVICQCWNAGETLFVWWIKPLLHSHLTLGLVYCLVDIKHDSRVVGCLFARHTNLTFLLNTVKRKIF